MSKTLGIGMVGARYGARMHQANYSKLPPGLIEIRGVCSLNGESADNFARDFNVGFKTDNLDELLTRKDIDVIDVCTPPSSHHEIALKAAQARKHIIVEKPLTGYFGEPGDPEPIGLKVSRKKMLEGAQKNALAVQEAVTKKQRQVVLC